MITRWRLWLTILASVGAGRAGDDRGAAAGTAHPLHGGGLPRGDGGQQGRAAQWSRAQPRLGRRDGGDARGPHQGGGAGDGCAATELAELPRAHGARRETLRGGRACAGERGHLPVRTPLPPHGCAAGRHVGASVVSDPRGPGGRLDGHASDHLRAGGWRRVRERGDQPGGWVWRRGLTQGRCRWWRARGD